MLNQAVALQRNEPLEALREVLVQTFDIKAAGDEFGAIRQGLAEDPLHTVEVAFRQGLTFGSEPHVEPAGTRLEPGARLSPR